MNSPITILEYLTNRLFLSYLNAVISLYLLMSLRMSKAAI
jgi:hypothetical protein